jgi:hypothetical protein
VRGDDAESRWIETPAATGDPVMLHRTVSFRTGSGWNAALPAELDSLQTLVLAFGASGFATHAAPLAELDAAFPRSVLVGCSTSGEIANAQLGDAGISVAVARFEHTRLRRALTSIDSAADSFDAGTRLAVQLAEPGLRAVFVLSDGLGVNGTPLVDGLARCLGPEITITGGLAGDGSRFERTWVLDRARPEPGRICAVGFYGDRLRVGHGCDGGWSDFGPERLVTRAEGNVLYELDGKPVLDLYRDYLGDLAAGLPGTALLFPLSVRRCGAADTVVRTILGIDESAKSLTFAGDVPQGSIARLMRAKTDALIGSAGVAAQRALRPLAADRGALVVSVSCVGRRLVLGERTEEEIESVLDAAPPGSSHVGFYSYGEISPPVPGGASELHNQTMTVTAFCEA